MILKMTNLFLLALDFEFKVSNFLFKYFKTFLSALPQLYLFLRGIQKSPQ